MYIGCMVITFQIENEHIEVRADTYDMWAAAMLARYVLSREAENDEW